MLENYGLHTYGINLRCCRYMQMQYYYESDDCRPVEARLRILNYLNDNNERVSIYEGGIKSRDFFAPLRRNRWASVIFELDYMPEVREMIEKSKSPILRQIKIDPLGVIDTAELSPNDVMYISSVTFYADGPVPSSLGVTEASAIDADKLYEAGRSSVTTLHISGQLLRSYAKSFHLPAVKKSWHGKPPDILLNISSSVCSKNASFVKVVISRNPGTSCQCRKTGSRG